MTSEENPESTITEVVGLFDRREQFDMAVAGLIQQDFPRDVISVLSSHEALPREAGETVEVDDPALLALAGELKYAFPLATAGLIAIAGGPVTAALAALVGAGIAGAAAKDYLDKLTAAEDHGDFERALEAGGVILWVQVNSAQQEKLAHETLQVNGGRNVHTVTRTAPE